MCNGVGLLTLEYSWGMVPPLIFLGSFAAATPAGVDQESTSGVETKAAASFVVVAGRVPTRDLCSGDLFILAFTMVLAYASTPVACCGIPEAIGSRSK